LARISPLAHELVSEQYQLLNQELFPALEKEGIRFLKRNEWNGTQSAWIKQYFEEQLLPIVCPIRLDPSHPFPRVLNKSLQFIVLLQGEDAFGQAGGMAVVQAPRPLPRLIRLPETPSPGSYDFVFLSSIIHAHMGDLFPGMEVNGCYQFRVTRNSHLFVDAEETEDLLRALEGELPSRRYGDEVRLEVVDTCPENVINFLVKHFGLVGQSVYRVDGPVNLHRLMALPELVDRAELKYPSFSPGVPQVLSQHGDIFEAIAENDILLNHPFESFAPVLDFVRQAAADPTVLAIKATLYRTGPESVLVESLLSAARAGKEVSVVIELLARFDEEANITLASKLQEAGAHVVYGVVGYKTHAKMLLVVRKEGGNLVRYVHLGTGNYHARTARIYTDYGLLTANKEIGQDVHRIFMQLTSLGSATKLKQLLQSPFTLHKGMLKYIEQEAENAVAGKPARIIAKMNSLIEPEIIRALYKASQAGVKIDLIVRGMCAVRPGVLGVSDNIRVVSIVGRFLEHSRIFYFENGGENGGDPVVYCASADWMQRNLFQRVETCFPILDERLRQRVITQGLLYYLEDNVQTWELQANGEYQRLGPEDSRPSLSVQDRLLMELAEKATVHAIDAPLPRQLRKRGKRGGKRVS